eukprot:m.18076 g.18076  ORF g.18076 m.18076 type:complete len:227 (-) comp5616_c0_seq1:51-731(-)
MRQRRHPQPSKMTSAPPLLPSVLQVLLWAPNVVGYVRICLVLAAFEVYRDNWHVFLALYCTQAVLDAVDGYLARKLDQCSAFGAWLDVAVDNIGRGLLWVQIFPARGFYVPALEFIVFVSTHTHGAHWKRDFETAPGWVQRVMHNGFRTPIGSFVIAGIHVLPIWLFVRQTALDASLFGLSEFVSLAVLALLVAGRVLGAAVEVWVLVTHSRALCKDNSRVPKAPG